MPINDSTDVRSNRTGQLSEQNKLEDVNDQSEKFALQDENVAWLFWLVWKTRIDDDSNAPIPATRGSQ